MSFNLAVILSETAHSSPDRPVALFDGGLLSTGSSTRPLTGWRLTWLRPGSSPATGSRCNCPTSRSS